MHRGRVQPPTSASALIMSQPIITHACSAFSPIHLREFLREIWAGLRILITGNVMPVPGVAVECEMSTVI